MFRSFYSVLGFGRKKNSSTTIDKLWKKSRLLVETLEDRSVPAAFTAGNLVVLRIGDGATALTAAATSGSFVELTTAGLNPAGGANIINIPTAGTANTGGVTFAGNTTASAGLEPSGNGQFLTTLGYDAPVGTAAVGSTTSAAANRNVVQVDGNGVVTIPVRLTDALSGNSARDAVTTDGTQYWVNGQPGVRTATPSATPTTSTSIATPNSRTIGIVGGNLVYTTNTTINRYSGLPTGTATATNIATLVDGYSFRFFDRQSGVGDSNLGGAVDTLYVANSNAANSIAKYFYDGAAWVAAGFAPLTSGSLYGLTGQIVGNTVALYATTNSAATSSLQSFTDTAAYNAPIAGSFTQLATAGTNFWFRGVSFAPQGATAPVVASPPTATAIESTTATLGGAATADGGAAITVRGIVYAETSIDSTPQIGEANVTNLTSGTGTGVFTVGAVGLVPNTGYTFASYATNSVGTTYSNFGSFTTLLTSTTSTSVVGSPASPQVFGTPVTFTATVTQSPSVGTVTFFAGPGLTNQIGSPVNVVNGVATSSSTTNLPIGTSTISAVYSGGVGFDGSTGTNSYTYTAAPINPTTTVVTGTPSGAQTFGTSVTFVATVSSASTPNGTVEFYDGATFLGSDTLDGGGEASVTTAALTLGLHTITANYLGTFEFAPSTDDYAQTINYEPGALIVSRVGTGTGSLGGNATATFLDNFTAGGSFIAGNTVALPIGSTSAAIGAASEAGNVVTIMTSAPHGFDVGDAVIVSGVTPSGYNGTFQITAVTSDTFAFTTATLGLGTGTAFGTATVPNALTEVGTATLEGYLVSAADGHSVSIAGYNQIPGSPTTGANRAIGVVGPSGSVDTSTQLPASTGSVRTSVSVDAFGFWVATSTGVRYVPFGNNGLVPSTQITQTVVGSAASPTSTNISSTGQLYATAAAGAQANTGVPALDSPLTIGTGLPIIGGQSIAVSPTFPTARDAFNNFPLPNQFAISPDGNTIYMADSRTDSVGGILKYYQTIPNQWTLVSSLQLDSISIASASEVGTTATITTTGNHGFIAGQTVTISGVGGLLTGGYNVASATIIAVTPNTFTYTAAAGLDPAVGGFATSTDGGLRALVADFSGANPVFYATTSAASRNRVVLINDTGDLNGDPGAGFNYGAISIAPVNTAYRGVTFAPTAAGATASATTLDIAGSPALYGTGVTLTATVTAGATGWVSFRKAGVEIAAAPIVGGTATYTTAGNLAAGSHSIVAVYTGDSTYAASTSASQSATIDQVTTTTTLTLSSASVSAGSNVILAATIAVPSNTNPTGTVSFFDGPTLLNVTPAALTQVIVGGAPTFRATFTTTFAAIGIHNLTAVYSGDTNFAGSTSASTPLSVVNPSTTVVTTDNANPTPTGETVNLTATVTGPAGTPTGTVQFYDNLLPIGAPVALSGGGVASATVTTALLQAVGQLTPGLHSISAVYTPDGASSAVYAGSTGVYQQAVKTQAFAADSQFIYRVGDGSTPLTVGSLAVGSTIYVDEYTPAGSLVQSIILPSADGTGAQNAIRAVVGNGVNSPTGQLSLSGDGRYLFLTGYDVNPLNAPTVASLTATNTIPRAVARIKFDGTIETMAFTAGTVGSGGVQTGGTFNGVYSPNGTQFYVSGFNGVSYFASFAPSATLVPASATIATTTFTVTGLLNDGGNLVYIGGPATGASNLVQQYVGFPTTATAASALPGVNSTTDPSQTFVVDAYFTHLDGVGAPSGINTFYLADDGPGFINGKITKWSLVAGTWTLTDTLAAGTGNTATTFYWLNGLTDGSGNVTLYSTFGSGGGGATGPGHLYSISDTNGFNAPIGAGGIELETVTTVASVATGTNTTFRGVASTPKIAATTTALISTPNASTGGNLVTFTATVAPTPGNSGTVTFLDNNVAISGAVNVVGGVATFQTLLLTSGTHPITAAYSGSVSAGFTPSTSNLVNQVVNAATTTTALSVGSPNPATTAQAITFTVTVSGGASTDGETVVIRDASNGNAVVTTTGGVLSGGSATIIVSAGALTVGSHNLFAVYAGNTFNGSSDSSATPVSQTITGLATSPAVVDVTVDGGAAYTAFAGAQGSRVVSLQVTFDQPVDLDLTPFALTVHANNQGLGSVPTTLNYVTTDGGTTWVITFDGNTDPTGAPPDGFQSIKDGVYDLHVDPAKVHPAGVPGVNGTAFTPFVFYRLFGDGTGEETPAGNAHSTIVAIDDNFSFRSSFNNSATYKAYFDFDGDGVIGIADNFQFRSRFNKLLTWTT